MQREGSGRKEEEVRKTLIRRGVCCSIPLFLPMERKRDEFLFFLLWLLERERKSC